MATITEPMALDKTFNTTETTPRSQADVLAAIENAIRQGFGRSAADVSYDNTTSGLTADDVQEAIDELAAEKVDKVEGKGLSSNDFTDEDKAALDNMELDIESTQTATGNPLTLTDCAPINAESLKVELQPKQDLHGYDYPWVGGAGKNKLPLVLSDIKSGNTDGTWDGNAYTLYGVTFTVQTDNGGNVTGITLNGTGTNPIIDFYLSGNTRKTLDGWGLTNGTSYILSGSHDNVTVMYNGTIANITDGTFTADTSSGSYFPCLRAYEASYSNVLIQPMVRLSTESDSTFAPYSNICPITGYTECEVDDVGKNKLPLDLDTIKLLNTIGTWIGNAYAVHGVTYTINTDDGGNVTSIEVDGTAETGYNVWLTICTKNTIAFLESGVQYILSGCPNGGSSSTYCLTIGDNIVANYDDIGSGAEIPSNTGILANDYFARIYVMQSVSVSNLMFYPMAEEGNTKTSFAPYQSTSATIQFGQTVYGGRSNFTDGGTDVIYGYDADLGAAGRPWWKEEDSGGVFRTELPLSKYMGILYCSMYKGVQKNWPDDGEICVTNTQAYQLLRIKDPACAGYTAAEFATYISGCQLAYELAEPTQLSTPPTDLKLLQGTNNLSADGVMQIGYQPDNVIGEVKGEIEKCAVDAEFMQFTDGTDTFTDVNLSLDASFHTVSVVGSKIEQKRFICFEVAEIRSGSVQGIHASCIAFADGAKTPSGTAFRAYIESLQMYVNFRIYGSGGSYTLAYQSETSFSASAFYVRVRMMNNL